MTISLHETHREPALFRYELWRGDERIAVSTLARCDLARETIDRLLRSMIDPDAYTIKGPFGIYADDEDGE